MEEEKYSELVELIRGQFKALEEHTLHLEERMIRLQEKVENQLLPFERGTNAQVGKILEELKGIEDRIKMEIRIHIEKPKV